MIVYPQLHWLDGNNVNVFLYEDEDGFVLCDTGMPKRVDVLGYLATLGHEPAALKHILITHADIDHIGNAETIRQATGATMYVSAKSAELIQNGDSPSHNNRTMKWVIDRFLRYTPTALENMHIVNAGDTLPLMGGTMVIDAPGHTADQVAYHSIATGILFSGDALHTRPGRLAPSGRFISADPHLARQTALKLARRTPAFFACGHGKPAAHTDDDLMQLLNDLRAES